MTTLHTIICCCISRPHLHKWGYCDCESGRRDWQRQANTHAHTHYCSLKLSHTHNTLVWQGDREKWNKEWRKKETVKQQCDRKCPRIQYKFMLDNHWRLMMRECVCVCKCGPFVFFALCARCIYRFKWPLEKEPFICITATTTTTAAVVNIDEHELVYEGKKIPQFSSTHFFSLFWNVLIVTHSHLWKNCKTKAIKSAKTEEKTLQPLSSANINECNFCTIELWWRRRWYDVCVCACFFPHSFYLWNVFNNVGIAATTTKNYPLLW